MDSIDGNLLQALAACCLFAPPGTTQLSSGTATSRPQFPPMKLDVYNFSLLRKSDR